MAGSKASGLKAAETIKEKFGDDYYQNIGAIGGKKGTADGTIKGFAAMSPEKRAAAGAIGGSRSRRKPKTEEHKQKIKQTWATRLANKLAGNA